MVTDRKISVETSPPGQIDYYLADAVTEQDYYPFGMMMDSRSFSNSNHSTNDYRFSFQGQEKDDELSGKGNSYTADYWQYDPRLGRRWNIDPKVEKPVKVTTSNRGKLTTPTDFA